MKSLPEDSDIAFVTPSDNIIDNEEKFREAVEISLKKAQESIVTFGIIPSSPHTGYGYIATEGSETLPCKVTEFKEKPDQPTAEEYIRKGYYWNSGSFLFSKKTFWKELKKWNTPFFDAFQNNSDALTLFENIPDLSIDYGLLEYSDNIYLSPLNCYWDDLGSFDAL